MLSSTRPVQRRYRDGAEVEVKTPGQRWKAVVLSQNEHTGSCRLYYRRSGEFQTVRYDDIEPIGAVSDDDSEEEDKPNAWSDEEGFDSEEDLAAIDDLPAITLGFGDFVMHFGLKVANVLQEAVTKEATEDDARPPEEAEEAEEAGEEEEEGPTQMKAPLGHHQRKNFMIMQMPFPGQSKDARGKCLGWPLISFHHQQKTKKLMKMATFHSLAEKN